MAFKQEFDRAVLNINLKCDKTVRAIALQLFAAIIKDTPVGNPSLWKRKPPPGYVGGRLRGNWQTTIGAPATGSMPDSKDRSGSATTNAMQAKVKEFKTNQKIYMTNNLPYAQAIEDGHSKQRPHGMVKTNVARFQAIVNRIAREQK